MERTDQGSFVVSAEEMRVLRQGLFVTLHHGDEEIRHNVQTITGYEPDEFRQLMWAVDEINGTTTKSANFLTANSLSWPHSRRLRSRSVHGA